MKTQPQLPLLVLLFGLALRLGAQSVIQFTAPTYNVTEGTPQVEVIIKRVLQLDTVVSVDFATVTNGTATAGADFVEVVTNLTFGVGETNLTVAIPILNDALAEPQETFGIVLSNPTVGAMLGGRSSATVRITDNDPGLQPERANYWVDERGESVVIAVTRGPEETLPATVEYATADGAAKAGSDYTATSGTLTFAAGEARKLVTIPILNDSLKETDRIFLLSLSNAMGNALGVRKSARVTIEDNDPGIQTEFAAYWTPEDAGAIVVAVTRGLEEDLPATVDYATADGTAKAGQDYTAISGTLSFAAGERVKLLSIPMLKDGLKETEETFQVNLSNAVGNALGAQKSVRVTIRDNDPGVQFVLPYSGWIESSTMHFWVEKAEGVIAVPVTRGNDMLLEPFTVEYAAVDVTATNGLDYVLASGVLEFGAGEVQRFLTVPIVNDGVAESDKKFRLVLSNPTGGMALGRFINATVTICDTTEMQPHRFDRIELLPEGRVSLTLGGGYVPGLGLSNRFQPYFDIYPLEVSTNLVDWTSSGWLVRTNAVATNVTFVDTERGQHPQRFYRTPTNRLVTPCLTPTGPYAVGKVERLIQNPDWRNVLRIPTNGAFMATIWYPAERLAGQLPSPWDPVLSRHPDWWLPYLYVDVIPYFGNFGVTDASFHPQARACPVVICSGGGSGVRGQLQDKCAALASHGYVVVDPDQPDYTGGSLPGGYSFCTPSITLEKTVATVMDRVRFLRRVVKELEAWNQTDPLFAGRLELAQLGALGASFGAEAVAEFGRVEPRCRAAINLDEWYFGTMHPRDLTTPTLTINHSGADVNDDTQVFDASFGPAIWFQISDAVHNDCGDWSWYGFGRSIPSSSTTLASKREATRTQIEYILWFFDKYVRGMDEPMPSLADHPRVINFKRK
jgi:hypothetical protein